jgi:hypothetical protein
MDHTKRQLNYRVNNSVSFADEIIIGEAPIISKSFNNYSDIELFPKPIRNGENKRKKFSQNYMLNFSILSFILIAFLILFSRIVTSTLFSFNSFSTSIFVADIFCFLH